jgi:hypothetical protein
MSLPKRTYRTALTNEALVKSLSAQERDYNGRGDFKIKGVEIHKVTGRIDSSAASGTYYIQYLDADDLPADGLISENKPIPSKHLISPQKINHLNGFDSEFDLDLTPDGIKAKRGLVLVASTEEFTKKIVTSDVMAATIIYH